MPDINDRIGLVILNYNDADNTVEWIETVSGYSLISVVIVIDNMSTDGSMERLKTLASNKVVVRNSGKNGGYGYGNNLGARIAKKEYGCKYAFISNSDVRCSEKNMRKVLHCFEEYPDCGVASGIQRLSDGTELKNMAWDIPTVANYALTAMFVMNKLYPRRVQQFKNEYEKVEGIAGSFLCVDLDKFFHAGGFDEELFLYCEETTLGIRMKRGGYAEYVARDAFYYHYHERGSIMNNVKKRVDQKKMLLTSRLYVVETYLTKSKLAICFAKLCYAIAMAEAYVKMYALKLRRTGEKS